MTEQEQIVSFARYGTAFQEKIIQAMLLDHTWSGQMYDVMDSSFFDKKHLQFLCQRFFDYYREYRCFPSLSILVTAIRDELKTGSDVVLRETIVNFLKRVHANPDPGDLLYVKEKSLDFCRKQAMKSALEESIDLISGGRYEDVVYKMRKAIAVGTLPSVGHDFFDEIDSRLVAISRNCIPTGVKQLDANGVLNGGLGKGELGVIISPAGGGKSHYLVMMGANAIRQGKNVVHYTFELNENYVGIRYDSNFCAIASNDVIDSKNEVKVKYQNGFSKQRGRLFIKEYPPNACSVITMKNHLERLLVTKGVKPDMIIVDYADIMKSTRNFDSPRFEIKLAYEELRALAQEMEVPVWTASQAHRDAAKMDVIGLENMSEAYAKAMIADFVVSMSRKPLEKASGTGRLFVAKNRMGRDGIVFPMQIDTARSIITVTSDDPMDANDVNRLDSNQLKSELMKKLDGLGGSGITVKRA